MVHREPFHLNRDDPILMERPDESMWIGVIKRIRLRPLDRDSTIKMHSRALDLSRYNSTRYKAIIKPRALDGDPMDHESTRSTRLIDKSFDPMLLIKPRHLHFTNCVELSPTR